LLCRCDVESLDSVIKLAQLLRADNPAVREMVASLIWQRYFRDLLKLARKNLDRRVRVRADEEDVVLSMFRSFCARQGRGDFDLASRDDLWKVLVTITLRKAKNLARDHHRERRDVAREQTLSGAADDESCCPGWALEQMDDSASSPAEATLLKDALERRLTMLDSPELRQIALWRLEGYTNSEIADRLDRTERSVERRLRRIRSKWSLDEDASN